MNTNKLEQLKEYSSFDLVGIAVEYFDYTSNSSYMMTHAIVAEAWDSTNFAFTSGLSPNTLNNNDLVLFDSWDDAKTWFSEQSDLHHQIYAEIADANMKVARLYPRAQITYKIKSIPCYKEITAVKIPVTSNREDGDSNNEKFTQPTFLNTQSSVWKQFQNAYPDLDADEVISNLNQKSTSNSNSNSDSLLANKLYKKYFSKRGH